MAFLEIKKRLGGAFLGIKENLVGDLGNYMKQISVHLLSDLLLLLFSVCEDKNQRTIDLIGSIRFVQKSSCVLHLCLHRHVL